MFLIYFCSIMTLSYSYLITGPIIGKVTNDSARILIESDIDKDISMILISNDSKLSLNKTIMSRTPTIFEFTNLVPYTKYFIFLPEYSFIIPKGSFRTL